MKKLLFLLLIPFIGFSQTPITQSNINDAVDLWLSNQTSAEAEYGHISNWDTSNVTDMYNLFFGATSFNQDIGNWDVSSVIDMWGMFHGTHSFNQDISNWNVSNVASMVNIFSNSGLSTNNYDNILIGWSQQNLQENVILRAVGINYCNGEDARQSMIDNYGWTITDDGYDCSNLSIEENTLDISIYPNPTTDFIYINSDTELEAVVFDLLGKQVLREYITDKLDISCLEKGTYIINLTDGVNTSSHKIIKN